MIEVMGGAVNVRRQGHGVPTVFVHGNPDSSALWMPVIERLAPDRYDCIAPDLPGFGASSVGRDNGTSLDWAAQWLDQLLTTLGVHEPVNLVVHDIGGFVGLAFAVRHPERVRRIVVTNTIFQADYHWHFWARVWRTRGLGELSMAALGIPGLGRTLLGMTVRLGSRGLSRAQIHDTYDHFHATARAQVLRLYRATDPAKFAGWEEAFVKLAERLPTRVIWGRHDPFIEARYATRFGTSDVHLLDEAGHWVAAEAPDRVAALIDEHFDR